MNMNTVPLLIEIGVEELPAGVASSMSVALGDAVAKTLSDAYIETSELVLGVTPRRLLIHAGNCPLVQADRKEVIWGPPEKVAFTNGNPTKSAEGFAAKSGLELDAFTLAGKGDGKGNYMRAVKQVAGSKVTDILADAMPEILRKLPSPKQMKWNDGDARDDGFIRPIRWIVARIGNEVIPFSFAGVEAGTQSCGHRIHGDSGELSVNDPFGWLWNQKVIANRSDRIGHINDAMKRICEAAGVDLVADDELIAEVADLTEWPVPVLCEFPTDYLRLPEEVIRITLKNHQRCFVTHTRKDELSNKFIAVANMESKDESKVAEGNARVVNARLADAAFYFDRDPKDSLDARVEKLSQVVFQEGLGMVGDQVRRLRAFVLDNAKAIGAVPDHAQRAAYLCKSDLTTGLVYEFPELQGYMGGVYGRMNGEPEEVARAIAEHYRPAGADDVLPQSPEARMIAIAERIDKLLGYFHLGKVPTASADPYGLRRAAIGLIRLLTDTDMPVEMPLAKVIDEAAKQWNQQRVTVQISAETSDKVREFNVERLLGMASYLGTDRNALDAAIGCAVEKPLYQIVAVAKELEGFGESETGQAVAAANKRIANILKKAELPTEMRIDDSLLADEAEKKLFMAIEDFDWKIVKAEKSEGELTPARHLELLAELREPVDRFFDDVMVMTDDEDVRNNRLALLSKLRNLFLGLADISRL